MVGPETFIRAGIALGSNEGDRAAEIDAAFEFLREVSADQAILASGCIETEPVDCPPGSAPFLNAVAEIAVDPAAFPPAVLLECLRKYEELRGRPREHARNVARPIDLDLLFYGDLVLNTVELTLPHPRATQRTFVLAPLAQIRPHLVLPGENRTVEELARSLAGGAQAYSAIDYRMTSREKLRHEKIEQLAYRRWEEEGRPEGRAHAHCLEAQRLYHENDFLRREIETEESEGGIVRGA